MWKLFFFFFPIFFQLPNKFSSLENRNQILKIENWEKNNSQTVGVKNTKLW